MKPSWCAITTCWSLNYTGLCSDQVWPLGAATVRNVLSGDCHCLTWGRRCWRQWDAVRSSLGLGEDRGVGLGGGAVLETVGWHNSMKSPDTTKVSSLYFMCIVCPHVCLCTTCMPDAYGGQKWGSDSLGLELQMVVNHHVGAGH